MFPDFFKTISGEYNATLVADGLISRAQRRFTDREHQLFAIR